MKYSLRIRSGFTLVEVALAATILLVGFAGMAEALIIGSEMQDTARKQTIATQIVQEEVERLHMQNWDSLKGPSANYQYSYTVSISTKLSQLAPASSLQCTGQVTPVYTDINSNVTVCMVTITVTWKSITGKPHSRSCSAYIGKYGLNVSYQKS